MFIRNKKSKLIQECSNKDVIKICLKDVENYEVTEVNPEEFTNSEKVPEPENIPEPEKNLEDMTVPELKALAKEKGIEGTSSLGKEDLLAVLKEVM
ncbi:Rho termination factor-like protein [Lacrimispora xylanisolvens]|uniref:Rho termination factor-like protein n=1 Tax=Lacrimispora xylanisolvens TaxID=384636 RepID=A0A2S6HSJ9_9FIRM|nr:Rho termination factor N-terminal domain-containing protein [Hungatella xylanolytica]PPK80623.1 Rho termination factor-like protein [Hungatella xylanolytica]